MFIQIYKTLKFILAGLLLLSVQLTSAQNKYTLIGRKIDSLVKLGLPKSAFAEVEKLDMLARKDKNAPQQIRAAIYRISIASYQQAGSLDTTINNLRRDIDQSDFPVKPVLQSLLAETYWKYYQQNRYQFAKRSRLENPGADFNKWDLRTIVDETNKLYKCSLQDVSREQRTSISVLEGVLIGEKSTRHLRPTLYDLLVQRAFEFYLGEEANLDKPKLPFVLDNPALFADSRAFAGLKITTSDTTSNYYQGIQFLQQATAFHLKEAKSEAMADIDLQRLRFLNLHAVVPGKDSLYHAALQKIVATYASKPISTDALVLLGSYQQERDSLIQAHAYFDKAIAAFPESLGAKNAARLISQLEKKSLSVSMEKMNIPGRPMLALCNYRNLDKAKMEVYRLSYSQWEALKSTYKKEDRALFLDNLKKITPLQTKSLNLQALHDYKMHSIEFSINPLPAGNYVLVSNYMSENANEGELLTGLTGFSVSGLAFTARLNPDESTELLVTGRESGKPLNGVKVKLTGTYFGYVGNSSVRTTTSANETGMSSITGKYLLTKRFNDVVSVQLILKGDTLSANSQYINGAKAGDANDHEPEDKTILFTDRQIYRPGQTLYFKGMQLQVTDNKSKIISGRNVELTLSDLNGKEIGLANLKTNEFGTFSGSFILPLNMPGGDADLETEDGRLRIKVEEYKRPTFSAEFAPVKDSYRLNDSVKLKGVVTAFSGYGLSNARVAYRVTRTRGYIYRDYTQARAIYGSRYQMPRSTEIMVDTVKTDNQGRFAVSFRALPETGFRNGGINYTYAVNADITDESGETHTTYASVVIGQNDIRLIADVPDKLFARDSLPTTVKINNLNGQPQKGSLQVEVYALKNPDQLFIARLWQKPDEQLLTAAEFKKDFPFYAYKNEDIAATWEVLKKVVDLNIEIDKDKQGLIDLGQLKNMPAAVYKVVLNARNEKGDTTSLTKYVDLVGQQASASAINNWIIPVSTIVKPGENAEFLLGTGLPGNIFMERYSGTKLISSEWIKLEKGQRLITIPIGATDKNVAVQFNMVYQNRSYNSYQKIIVIQPNRSLNIKMLTFRDRLLPGQKEQWKLQISSQNGEKPAAEMLAGLYDASLDEVSPAQNWLEGLNPGERYQPNYFAWNSYSFIQESNSSSLEFMGGLNFPNTRGYEVLDFSRHKDFAFKYDSRVYNFGSDAALSEVVVVGYGTQRKQTLGSTTITLRGISSFINSDAPSLAETLQGKVAGVAVTRSNASSNKPVALRKNFSETAFFYPQLRTDEKGQILIEFTIPEALTKWKFRALAHTKDFQTGYTENEVVTQKQLSISANMPRFLREGDTVTVSARLANLTSAALKGKIVLRLFNGASMQPVSLLENAAEGNQNFEVKAMTNQAVSFKLVIPAGLEALTYRLTAEAEKHSDGEENTIPVLPNRMLVTESLPMMVRAGQMRDFTFDKLLNNKSTTLRSKTLTLEYTQNPAWYAVQALPYLMEFPYECSEQIFSRYYANSMAVQLVNSMPAIKQVFDRWKSSNSTELLSNMEKNQELKSILLEETPWLRDATSESEQKKRLALLFDLNRMSNELKLNIEKLQQKQLPDGGFPWFGGGKADRYISQHILGGIGELYHLNIANNKSVALGDIKHKLVPYLDQQLLDDEKMPVGSKLGAARSEISALEIHAWYVRSFFKKEQMSATLKIVFTNYIERAEQQWLTRSIYEQGMIALTLMRADKPLQAKTITKSLLENAQSSADMGMSWAKNQRGYYWYQSPVETQALMIALFTEAGNYSKEIEEMKIWLLRDKQTNNWKTTKATAAACYALLMKQRDWLLADAPSEISLNGTPLKQLKPDIKAEAGSGYLKTSWTGTEIKPDYGKIAITNKGNSVSWGAMYWQYLEQMDKITPSATDIHLERKYFIMKNTGSGPVATAVDATHQPKTGDLMKVIVYLKAGRDYEYVHLKDMRPAGTEPVDALSSYKYQDGLSYYQVTRDVATNFFISRLNKGNYVFEYQLRVAQPGSFSAGTASVQCMYAPEFNAHSEGLRMKILR